MTAISDNAQRLLEKRYYLRNEHNELLEHSWDDICKRVSNNIASTEKDKEYWQNKFYDKMVNMDFIPSSPCLFNAGASSQQLSSCFVLDIEDNIESIFNTIAECAKIFQRCGGAGFSMCKIRPKGTPCKSSGSTASGVISFMTIFNEVVNQVKQGNKRNGALKIDLPVNHPEIFEFIHCKDDTSKLNNMNISVSLTAEFINAVDNNLDWDLKFNNNTYKTVKAIDLWNEIIESAWKTGEPGLSYQTNMNAGNMNPHIYTEVYGNPCHEFVNIPYTSCNLASVNLLNCIKNGILDEDILKENIQTTYRFLDDMITVNKLPLKKIQDMTNQVRPIGLGTMSFGNLLYKLKIPYNSNECLEYANYLYNLIYNIALDYNKKLAQERGEYPLWKGSKWNKEKNIKVRNSSMLSIAPNGSIAFIANTTGGIEPEFALVYTRQDNEGSTYFVVNSIFESYLKENNLFSKEILNRINNNNGSIQGMDDIFNKEIQGIFVVAGDILPEWHVKVLSTIQKYVDLSISKTVNMPKNASKEDIGNIYLLAGKSGIKGITVYRDGSRELQVLTTGSTYIDNKNEVIETELPRGYIEEVPDDLTYRKYKLQTGCGSLYFFLGVDDIDNKIYDCFTNTDGVGGCTVNTQSNSRLLSAALRGGVPVEYLIQQLEKAGTCPSYQYVKGKQNGINVIKGIVKKYLPEETYKQINDLAGTPLSIGKSCSSAIANVLKNVIKELSNEEHENISYTIATNDEIIDIKSSQLKCPECGERLCNENGCIVCRNCGYSKCG